MSTILFNIFFCTGSIWSKGLCKVCIGPSVQNRQMKDAHILATRPSAPTYDLCCTVSSRNESTVKNFHELVAGGPSSPETRFFIFLISLTKRSRSCFHFFLAKSPLRSVSRHTFLHAFSLARRSLYDLDFTCQRQGKFLTASIRASSIIRSDPG